MILLVVSNFNRMVLTILRFMLYYTLSLFTVSYLCTKYSQLISIVRVIFLYNGVILIFVDCKLNVEMVK
jgi:hypothetical protein